MQKQQKYENVNDLWIINLIFSADNHNYKTHQKEQMEPKSDRSW
jgi:hypothetical protein